MEDVPYLSIEVFPKLLTVKHSLVNAFIGRVPNVEMKIDRVEALKRLKSYHAQVRMNLGLDQMCYITAEQVHSADVSTFTADTISAGDKLEYQFPKTDSIITNVKNVCLGIYVADCCAVYFYDPIQGAIGLAHSGKKGTEGKIVTRTIQQMQKTYGSDPSQMIVQLSPCIRPPFYEVDIPKAIIAECREANVSACNIHDCQSNTAADLGRYYSYRMELGKTGRMLALLAIRGR